MELGRSALSSISENRKGAVAGACHLNQMDPKGRSSIQPPNFGSPASEVASSKSALAVPVASAMDVAWAKWSLVGAATSSNSSCELAPFSEALSGTNVTKTELGLPVPGVRDKVKPHRIGTGMLDWQLYGLGFAHGNLTKSDR